ncbi:hypothetical protein [Kurthia senegalensis]|uniref:hypothetical protein n=1 Tax=Kurthia senegalensis TaxID=1033740 RepID=UPI0002887334|nr:hypothetical protein [Kurthia senegalensis]
MRKKLFKQHLHDAMKKQCVIDQLYKLKVTRLNGKHLEECEYHELRRALVFAKMKEEVLNG